MKRTIYKIHTLVWVILIMVTTIWSPFQWLPMCVMVGFVLFLVWFTYTQVYKQLNWNSTSDIICANAAVSFFGSMMSFLVPCLYKMETMLKWDNWCQYMVLIWMLSILISLGTLLITDHKTMGGWKYPVIAVFGLVLFAFTISILGIFNIYLI